MALPQAILKGSGADFNNDLGGDSNSCPVLSPRCLFKSNSNNGPSLGHSNLVSDEVCICSGLHLWFLGGYNIWPRASCLISIMTQEMILIVVAVWPCGVYSKSTWIMTPSPSHSHHEWDREYICSGLLLMVFWWMPYLSKGRMSDLNNGPEGTRIVPPYWPMVFIWVRLE